MKAEEKVSTSPPVGGMKVSELGVTGGGKTAQFKFSLSESGGQPGSRLVPAEL